MVNFNLQSETFKYVFFLLNLSWAKRFTMKQKEKFIQCNILSKILIGNIQRNIRESMNVETVAVHIDELFSHSQDFVHLFSTLPPIRLSPSLFLALRVYVATYWILYLYGFMLLLVLKCTHILLLRHWIKLRIIKVMMKNPKQKIRRYFLLERCKQKTERKSNWESQNKVHSQSTFIQIYYEDSIIVNEWIDFKLKI